MVSWAVSEQLEGVLISARLVDFIVDVVVFDCVELHTVKFPTTYSSNSNSTF